MASRGAGTPRLNYGVCPVCLERLLEELAVKPKGRDRRAARPALGSAGP